jgi:inward rectifier potassium channel
MDQNPFDPGITQSYSGRLRRIVNRDGSFNVRRRGVGLGDFHVFRFLIGLSWPLFLLFVLSAFIAVNLGFAGLYLAAGAEGLQGARTGGSATRYLDALFFSVQTLTTVGYGIIAPRSVAANVIASAEAMLGVMGFAFGAGLLYGRFSRPRARILFSTQAVVAPYQGKSSIQFRIANLRSSAITDLEATVVLMSVEGEGAEHRRSYAKLELERSKIFFLPLTWTIVHPLDESSPLFGVTQQVMDAKAMEILVLIRGFDDTFSQVINVRSSYRYDEILWGYRFAPAFRSGHDGQLVLDLAKIDDVREASLGD